MGRYTIYVAMGIGVLIAPQLRVLDQAYQFIQEYSSFITPGVFAIFILGMFWKRTTSAAALTAEREVSCGTGNDGTMIAYCAR